jgi:UDP:flavonoid glycosyltransferase YjiC (YdhE family)
VKVLLVTRGTQGDAFPYLSIAKGLKERGASVTISLPFEFEEFAKELDVAYILQDNDIKSMVSHIKLNELITWLGNMIKSQFEELLPLVEKNDVFMASNTEFAAPTIAEYAKKPFIRTAYSPYIPGKNILPPVSPLVNRNFFITPSLMWKVLNFATNSIAIKPVNKWRKEHGLSLLKDNNEFMYSYSNNVMLYSPLIGSVDNQWKYPWSITGYCFNDHLPYDRKLFETFIEFSQKDSKPMLFFTAGSINDANAIQFVKNLYSICKKHNYKLVIGSGWLKLEEELQGDDIFVFSSVLPHSLIFKHFTALLHHGGSGTTHSAARSGKPQMVVPLIADQFYWGECTRLLGLGPGSISIKRINYEQLESKIVDLVTNKIYAEKAALLSKEIFAEDGVKNVIAIIESCLTKS